MDTLTAQNRLDAAARDTESYVARAGWDQPLRLFALVHTGRLRAHEPGLHLTEVDDDAWTAIEQDDLPSNDIVELVESLAWPDEVDGVALALERSVLPEAAEAELAAGADAETVAAHPDRRDLRLVVAVTRDGTLATVVRFRDHDRDEDVAVDPHVAPGLADALLEGLTS